VTTGSSTTRVSRDLNTGWSLQLVSGPAPTEISGRSIHASVPGSVHTDLMEAGLIPDPYLDNNEALCQWVGLCVWQYRTVFLWSENGHRRHDLVFEGLDTVARVAFNGVQVLVSRNMHRTFRVPVQPREGENELLVTFESPIRYADSQSLTLGYRPATGAVHPYNAIRKMACSYGWDWGLATATSGIWRPVRLESWSGSRLVATRPITRLEGDNGLLTVCVDIEKAPDGSKEDLRLVARIDGLEASVDVPVDALEASLDLMVPDVQRWWPRGFGDPQLYDAVVELWSRDGALRDSWRGRVGFRTVEVKLEPDEHGTSFRFVINGTPVFIRGVNWIPDDAFPHRVTRARYAKRLDQALSANVNLLRVWGGGTYESDDFYNMCDELGILTWQDFLFACAAYSEEEPLRAEVEAEARDNIIRLCAHPSLVLWNGNNENIWAFHDWGWQPRLDGRSWGLAYYTELLPRMVARLDPGRAYTAASPWSGSVDIHPNDIRHGSVHQWEQWNQLDYVTYRDVVPRFSAEFGWQGPPTWSTLTRSLSDEPLTPQSPGMQAHQKAANGNDKLTDGLVPHFRMPDDMDAWHWAMSLNQAHAVQVAVEHLRSWSPRCQGSVLWQLNDCWPVVSWAAVDGDGRAKPTLHALKHAYADRLVTIQPRGEGLGVVVVNDSADRWRGELSIRRLDFSGDLICSETAAVDVEARGSQTIMVSDQVARAGAQSREILVASLDDSRGIWYFAEPRDSELEPAVLDLQVRRGDGEVQVHVRAGNLVRDLTLLVDKVGPQAEVDDMLVTLLPGESVTFSISTTGDEDIAAYGASRVVRSANELVAPDR